MDIEALMKSMETTSCAVLSLSAICGMGHWRRTRPRRPLSGAWRSREDFRGASSEKAWLTSIAVNVCRNMLRSPWHSRRVDLEILERVPAEEREAADDTVIRAALGPAGKISGGGGPLLLSGLLHGGDCPGAGTAPGNGIDTAQTARERLKPALKEWYYAEY